MVVIKRWRKAGEILTIWYFWLTCEKVGRGFQYHHGGARCPAYGFGVVQLSAQPNRCTFVQSRAKNLIENYMARPCSANLEVTIAEFPSRQPPNVPFPKGKSKKSQQIANQYGFSVQCNSRFRHDLPQSSCQNQNHSSI
jgi:hypothetical protein